MQFAGFGGGLHARAVLLESDVSVANIEQSRVFQLLDLHFDLSLDELRALVVRLQRTVAQRNVDTHENGIVGIVVVEHRSHSIAETCEVYTGGGTGKSGFKYWRAIDRNRIAVRIHNWYATANDCCWAFFKRVAGQADAPVLGANHCGWEQRVASGLHVNGRVLQVVFLLEEVGALCISLLQRFLEAGRFGLRRRSRLVGGNDLYVDDFGIKGIAGDGVLKRLLVLQLNSLRHDEILPVGSQLRFGASDIERSHGADLELLLIVVVEFLGNGNGLLLDFDVFTRVDKLPVSGDGAGRGGDGLLRESEVGNLAVVLCNDDVAAIHGQAESAEQVLVERDEERRLHRGIEEVGGNAVGRSSVIKSHAQPSSCGEILRILRVVG